MRFPGIIPAVTTPFDERGEIDAAGLAANVRFLLDAGVHGLVATGTMGEAGSLSDAERRRVVETGGGGGRRPGARDRRRVLGHRGGVDRLRGRRGAGRGERDHAPAAARLPRRRARARALLRARWPARPACR